MSNSAISPTASGFGGPVTVTAIGDAAEEGEDAETPVALIQAWALAEAMPACDHFDSLRQLPGHPHLDRQLEPLGLAGRQERQLAVDVIARIRVLIGQPAVQMHPYHDLVDGRL